MKQIIGRKMGMTEVFAKDGTMYAVTVVEVLPNVVTQVKTKENVTQVHLLPSSNKEKVLKFPLDLVKVILKPEYCLLKTKPQLLYFLSDCMLILSTIIILTPAN